jgi:branched-chain amino acid transport system permease protein
VGTFIALLVSGITYGATLCVVALGFLVLYKATGVINFAHGDLMTLGAYLAFWLTTSVNLSVVPGYLIAVLLMLFVGAGLERAAYAPLRRQPVLVVIISTLGAATAIRAAVNIWQGAVPKPLGSPVHVGGWNVAGGVIPFQSVLTVGTTICVVTLFALMFQRTSIGRQLRALADDREVAQLMGMRVRRLSIAAFAASAGLAGLAGVLIAPLTDATLTLGFNFMLTAFAAAIIGGFGSISGTLAAAMGLGVVQQVVGGYLFPSYSQAIPFVLMIAAILARPSGFVTVARQARL